MLVPRYPTPTMKMNCPILSISCRQLLQQTEPYDGSGYSVKLKNQIDFDCLMPDVTTKSYLIQHKDSRLARRERTNRVKEKLLVTSISPSYAREIYFSCQISSMCFGFYYLSTCLPAQLPSTQAPSISISA